MTTKTRKRKVYISTVRSMVSNTRKQKHSNLSLCDEPIQQSPSLVHYNMVHHQASNSQHGKSIQQNTNVLTNGSNDSQNGENINEQRGTTNRTRKPTQSSLSLPHGPIQQPPSLVHSHMVDNQAHNSQQEEPSQQNTCELINGGNELENEQSSEEQMEKKTRGPTYMLEIWGRASNLPLIKLDFDNFGRPIGANQSKFSEFLGTLARNGKYCPLDVEDWHKMPNECKKEMLNIVKSRFDITLADEDWILKSICKKWRGWKHHLKTEFFVPDKEVVDLIDDKDARVSKDQWANMLIYWNKPEVKVRSEKNKSARAGKNMDHSTGKRSFAEVYDKLTKKKGRAPSRAEMFEVCYKPTDGTDSTVSKYLDAMKEQRNQLPEGSEDPVSRDDIFAKVIGQDKPGRVRMFGGVSPSNVWGEVPNRNQCKRIMLEQRSEILEMKNQIAELRSQLLTQPRFASHESHGFTSLPNNLFRPALTKHSLQVGGLVTLKSLFDPTKIVAKGCLYSTDPSTRVGGQVLGENWCEIQVKIVLQPEEQLIRPYDYYQTLGDALGEMIAWPCHLVTPSECR